MKYVIWFLLIFLNSAMGDEFSVVAVGDATLEKTKIQFATPIFEDELKLQERRDAESFINVMRNDFLFYKKYFEVPEASSARSLTGTSINFSVWSGEANVVGRCFFARKQSLSARCEFYKASDGSELYMKTVYFNHASLRQMAHDVSGGLYQKLMGKEAMFKSKILFVSDRDGNRANPIKELYVMDFDGFNKRKLTNHRGTVISPAISSDKKKVLYSLIREGRKKRNINLYMMNLDTGTTKLLSARSGINSGAVFMPGDKEILLTLSHQGNAEIYIMNLASEKLTRLTKHIAPDVDPSINKDASLLTFLSGRPGKAMIYTMVPTSLENKIKRVSYVGKFNATPRFDPEGKEIVFSSWLDNRFDLFRINADGTGLSRLTKDFGSNEDPTYAPDGEFIAFSSQRVLSRTKAVQNIYIMDRDGEILGAVTEKFGNCITPRWSK